MTKNIVGFNKSNESNISKNQNIEPAMILDFIDSKLKKNIQNGGDGYTIDVSKSINGMVGWSRYSFNYAPIIYGDLLPCENKKVLSGGSDTCGCVKQTNEPKSVYELLQQNGGNKIKTNQFDAIQQVGKGLLPLSPNNLINLILLIFLYHSVVDSNVNNKKIKQTIKKGGNNLISIIAPLGRGNLLVLSSLLLLHHFAVEKPSLKKQLKGGNNNIYEQMNKILEPLGLKKGISPILSNIYDGFKLNSKNKKEQEGGNILKSIIAPLGINAFIATGLLLTLKKVLIDQNENKLKKGCYKDKDKDFNKLVNLLGHLSFNAFANEQFIKELFKINKNNSN